KFFEDTIGSLEEGPDHCRTRQVKAPDQDIIDLVHPEPDFVQTKEPLVVIPRFSLYTLFLPGFQSMFPTRESHSEVKPRHDPMDSLPSEYNPTLPGGTHGSTDYSYHPPGCIPTPVLIAQNIALHRRQSLESEKPPSYSNNIPVKQGPPTSAKPTRFPANINMTVGNKEQQNQSVANTSIQERRSQMLANLTGTSHPLLLDDPQQAIEQKDRNTPTRNISPRDPERDQSRAEALSKLGLTRNQATSGAMTPAPVAMTRNDLPDILSSHIDKSQSYPAKSEPLPTEAAPQVLSPDHKQKPASMFRPESITVQFSGRGPMTESRKEALRKLGLLKES
uniref:Proline and serine rich 2 n=1 Tax=Monopterus albus TaxID=43700 RepID=A0A3Q3IH01_MONAL